MAINKKDSSDSISGPNFFESFDSMDTSAFTGEGVKETFESLFSKAINSMSGQQREPKAAKPPVKQPGVDKIKESQPDLDKSVNKTQNTSKVLNPAEFIE